MVLTIEFLANEPWLLMQVASCLDAREVGKLELISHKLYQALTMSDKIWSVLFYFHFIAHRNGNFDELTYRKIFRPFKTDTIGWTVRVLQSDETLQIGHIVDYRQSEFSEDEYLVSYDDVTLPVMWVKGKSN